MFTSAELVSMQATVAASFLDTVALKRPGAAVDSERRPTMALTTVATVSGWLLAGAAGQRGAATTPDATGGEAAQTRTAALFLPSGTAARPGDLAVIDGTSWRITTVTDRRTHVRCDVEVSER